MPLLILLGGLLAWEGSVFAGWLSALFFPAPSTILKALGEALLNGSLLKALTATLARLCVGLVSGGAVGVFVGLLMGWSRRLGALFDPLVAALYPIPKIAILPLVMILFGIGETSKIVLIAVSSFFPLLINTMVGVQQTASVYREIAENYGASRRKFMTRVLVPGSLPLILAGTRLAFNTAFVITLSVELLTTQTGLGATIWLAWQTMRLRQLYATLVVIALLGLGANFLIAKVTARLVPWQTERSS
ncbi:MAG: ABC transporter permease [Chloroflexi bacterium]|nr:ABC transporter permease [Chloroflexota bacterium]